MNRMLRRLARFGKRMDVQPSVIAPHTPQNVSDVRAKSEGHKKKTADKWNQ